MPKCQIVQLDLSANHAWEVLEYIIITCDIIAAHAGPPCGTCSQARGIPLPDGSPGPQPLRSAEHLLGLPHLEGADLEKVRNANLLYERLGNFIKFLDKHNIPWIIENPTNSFLWDLPFFEYAVQHGTFAHCHACAFGSDRMKKTSFLSNKEEILVMNKFCDDVAPHEHKEWGYNAATGFATAQEAQYPDGMCSALVEFLDSLCDQNNISLENPANHPPRVAKQARGRATPQLIPEYKRVVSMRLQQIPQVDHKRCLVSACKTIPCGSKLLRSEKKGEKFLCIFGIFHTDEEFVSLARSLWHPFDLAVHMPDSMLRCLFLQLTLSPSELVRHRINMLKYWTDLARELGPNEADLRSKMHPDVKRVLGPKRLNLMQRIASDMQWPDTELFKEMAEGFRIVGNATKSNVFKPGLKAATKSEEQLMKDSAFMRPALLGKIRSDKADELNAALFELTASEASEKGWLQGPFSTEEISGLLGKQWLPVRRFGVVQKQKLRPIDDYKENSVNDAFSCTERATMYAMDYLVWATLALLRLYKDGGEFRYTLSDGHCLQGFVHKEWLALERDLKITALDLKSGYKQLPLHPGDYNKSVVSLWDVGSNDVRCFVTKTLPFGASGSVYNFLRVSEFLQAAGSTMGILWANYFDDFPVVSWGKRFTRFDGLCLCRR